MKIVFKNTIFGIFGKRSFYKEVLRKESYFQYWHKIKKK